MLKLLKLALDDSAKGRIAEVVVFVSGMALKLPKGATLTDDEAVVRGAFSDGRSVAIAVASIDAVETQLPRGPMGLV